MSGFDWIVIYALAGIWLASGIVAIGILIHAARKPVSETDKRLSRIDIELTERERAISRGFGGGWRN